MGGFKIGAKGDKPFEKTSKHLVKIREAISKIDFDAYGKMGVEALAAATPKDSGASAEAWDYEIVKEKDRTKLIWTNDNTVGYSDVPIVILLQYGHMTKNGVYIEGNDFVNPAIAPVLNDIAIKIWKEIKGT